MTRDEILQMAEQAGCGWTRSGTEPVLITTETIVRFAKAIADKERECCAVTAWNTGMDLHTKQHDSREIGSACARAIRARGEKSNNGEVKE